MFGHSKFPNFFLKRHNSGLIPVLRKLTHLCGGPSVATLGRIQMLLWPMKILKLSQLSLGRLCIYILHCIGHFPFVFTLQVIIVPTPENVKRHTRGQRRPIFNCSLQLRLTVESGTPRHPARSSTIHCQSELLGTVKNSVFAGRWCGVCPNQQARAKPGSNIKHHFFILFPGLQRS